MKFLLQVTAAVDRCVSCGTLFIEPPEGLKEITS